MVEGSRAERGALLARTQTHADQPLRGQCQDHRPTRDAPRDLDPNPRLPVLRRMRSRNRALPGVRRPIGAVPSDRPPDVHPSRLWDLAPERDRRRPVAGARGFALRSTRGVAPADRPIHGLADDLPGSPGLHGLVPRTRAVPAGLVADRDRRGCNHYRMRMPPERRRSATG